MHSATSVKVQRIMIWLVWLLLALLLCCQPSTGVVPERLCLADQTTVVLARQPGRELFPWWPRWHWRKWARLAYQRFQRAKRLAQTSARLAHLALSGALSLARVVDWLTQQQLQRQLGALPVLYAVLDTLQVRQIINRYCPQTRAVDHGTVALILILNCLLAPRPLWRVADWYARTMLVTQLGVPASQLNDDRLARTLEAIAPYSRDIWQAVVSRALEYYAIDLSVIFYDLTAFVVHGAYAASKLATFGFAHNAPLNKLKIKAGMDASADGGIPLDYQPWAGKTADKATVEANLKRLQDLCLIETQYWDGSVLRRLTPLSAEQAQLVQRLNSIVPGPAREIVRRAFDAPRPAPPRRWLLAC